ncbi:hypothetical protein BS78_K068700 [Paspalum vaginatum]|uniref:Uncharacterized protein n=1 Tax=Paspalum vaginatum TaxID=158149 RepID=A0A9W7XBP9_9POAL|nr:hypothetical protein BS78_K068700 [Paspalum vaginatum]
MDQALGSPAAHLLVALPWLRLWGCGASSHAAAGARPRRPSAEPRRAAAVATTQVPSQADAVAAAQVGGQSAILTTAQVGGHTNADLASHGVAGSSSSIQLEHEEIPDWFQDISFNVLLGLLVRVNSS